MSMSTTPEAPITEAQIDLIQRVLPHRYPFLLVDRVKDIVLNTSCTGYKAVTFNEPQFQGHFPGMPVFPGVMIIEAMAQTAGVLVGLSKGLIDTNAKVFFMSIENTKFRRKVGPGDMLEMRLTVLRGGGRVWKFEGKAYVEGELACESTLTAMFDSAGG
jgi:3-hydroxyacyl-[acyl-carrier-protein] dehydratase